MCHSRMFRGGDVPSEKTRCSSVFEDMIALFLCVLRTSAPCRHKTQKCAPLQCLIYSQWPVPHCATLPLTS